MSKSLAAAPKRSGKTEKKILKLKRYCADKKELERFAASYGRLRNMAAAADGIHLLEKETSGIIEEEKVRLLRKTEKFIKETRMIDIAIDAVADGTQALILRYRYIDGLSWKQITEELCYSTRSIHYLHKKALEALVIQEKLCYNEFK